MASSNKRFSLYYGSNCLPTSPAMLVVSEVTGGPWAVYLREGHDNGTLTLRAWAEDNQESLDRSISKVVEKFSLSNTFTVVNDRQPGDLRKNNPQEIDAILQLTRQIRSNELFSTANVFVEKDIHVDFWGMHVPDETRPYRNTKGVEGFTFGALKQLWKVLNKSGHSNKSKTDLFEGFAETAVEVASSDAMEGFLGELPRRMLVATAQRYRRSGGTSDIPEANRILAVISRIAGGALFATDHSPDIDERNITEDYRIIDLKDPYVSGALSNDDNEMSALDALNNMYVKRKQ